MSLTLPNNGGTQNGGKSVILSSAGKTANGKVSFVLPTHTRLAAREVDFTVAAAKTTNSDAGVARAGAKILLANRTESATCCSVKAGSVIIDIGIRWSLNQDESLVDEAIDIAQSILYTEAFANAIKKGLLPQ